jgi:hypothetical protein
MLRKGQMQGVKKRDIPAQIALVATLFGAVASTEPQRGSPCSLSDRDFHAVEEVGQGNHFELALTGSPSRCFK